MKYYIFSKRKDDTEDAYSLSAEVNTLKEVEKHINDDEYFGDPNNVDFIVIEGKRINVEHIERNVLETDDVIHLKKNEVK